MGWWGELLLCFGLSVLGWDVGCGNGRLFGLWYFGRVWGDDGVFGLFGVGWVENFICYFDDVVVWFEVCVGLDY